MDEIIVDQYWRELRRRAREFPETFDAAVKLLMPNDPSATTIAAGRKDVLKLMAELYYDFVEPNEPPLLSESHRQLAETASLCRVLGRKVADLYDGLFADLAIRPDGIWYSRQIGDLVQRSGVGCLIDDPWFEGRALAPQLAALERLCEALSEALPRPRGGRATVHTGHIGNRMTQLVARCGLLLIAWRRDLRITTTPGKPLYTLSSLIYTLMTGADAEDAGLKRYVEDAVPKLRAITLWQSRHRRRIEYAGMGRQHYLGTPSPPEIWQLLGEYQELYKQLFAGPPPRRSPASLKSAPTPRIHAGEAKLT